MKLGITQIAQLTVQALDHQAKSLSQKILPHADAEALYQQVHAEAEKSRAALRLLLRDLLDSAEQAARREGRTATREDEEKAHAIKQAQSAIDRIVGKYQPHRIAA